MIGLQTISITQIDFAEKMNCNRQKIVDWERGKSTPSANDLILIAKYFNVTTDYFLGLSNVKSTNKDIQFVCDYTGQSEEVIEFLVFLKKMGGCNLIDLFKNELVVNWVHQNFEKR